MLQCDRINKYMNEYELSRYDATILVKDKEISDFFELTLEEGANPKISTNWINGIVLSYLNKNELSINDIMLTPKMLTELIKKVEDGDISIKQGKEVLVEALDKNKDPNELIKELGVSQIVDDEAIRNVIIEVINENPDSPKRYKEGKTNIVDYLVGQVMKKTKGMANPLKSMNIMKDEIEKAFKKER
jgi:aspartyl-tRNA(Asn)/glutamyl-tRNA(Gln) amidotransferase subunit B